MSRFRVDYTFGRPGETYNVTAPDKVAVIETANVATLIDEVYESIESLVSSRHGPELTGLSIRKIPDIDCQDDSDDSDDESE